MFCQCIVLFHSKFFVIKLTLQTQRIVVHVANMSVRNPVMDVLYIWIHHVQLWLLWQSLSGNKWSVDCADIESLTEVDGVGRNCVMYAVHYSLLDTLQMLLENGADVNLQCHGRYRQLVNSMYQYYGYFSISDLSLPRSFSYALAIQLQAICTWL